VAAANERKMPLLLLLVVQNAAYEEFCQYLIREKLICRVPWDDTGPYVRLSVTFQAATPEEEQQVVAEIRQLSDMQFEF